MRKVRISMVYKFQKKKYKAKIDFMPTLKQIQDYVKTRRKNVGDNNNIHELDQYVQNHLYEPGMTKPESLFTFGHNLVECD